jgi:hypothetical protein
MTHFNHRDIKNLHLSSKRLNEIANNHPHNLLVDPRLNVELFKKSSRIYEDVRISECEKKFSYEIFEEMFAEIGVFVKKLDLNCSDLSAVSILKFLSLFPNLRSLKFNWKFVEEEDESEELSVKLPRLKDLRIETEEPDIFQDKILKNLTGFNLKAISVGFKSSLKLLPFLQSHQKTLKKLTLKVHSGEFKCVEFFADLKDLKLQTLSLNGIMCMSHLDYDFIFEMKALEVLQINHRSSEQPQNQLILSPECTDKLYKLTNLQKLEINGFYSNCNILSGLRFDINENLTELKGPFRSVDQDFVEALARCLPNLRKLTVLESNFQYTDVWKCFKNLEYLHISHTCNYYDNLTYKKLRFRYDVETGEILEKLKNLAINYGYFSLVQETAEILVHDFPNLEELYLSNVSLMPYESIKVLLKGLKNLKVLYIRDNFEHKDSNVLVNYVEEFGRNLKLFHISCIKLNDEIVRQVLGNRKDLRISTLELDITL